MLGARPERQTDLCRPCTPSRGRASAVLAHPLIWARCGPRRTTTIWGTWTTNLSASYRPTHLGRRERVGDVLERGQHLPAQQRQHGDEDDCDQDQNERVLDQTLPPLARQQAGVS